MATINSEINLACQEANPPMAAFLSPKGKGSSFGYFVQIYDTKKWKWQYAYHLHLQSPWIDELELPYQMWTVIDAYDGELVCFILFGTPPSVIRCALLS